MVKVIFIEHDGNNHEVDAYVGESLMEAAVSNNVPGIDADCGGSCACATCHVYIGEEWLKKLNPRDDDEESMLDQAFYVLSNSRLGCQMEYTEELDGMELTLAPE